MIRRAHLTISLRSLPATLRKAMSTLSELTSAPTESNTNATNLLQLPPKRPQCVLAPMVRTGELPTRLMALKYGADLVWGTFASPH